MRLAFALELTLALAGIVSLANTVAAQPAERLRLSVNGGGQLGSHTVSQAFDLTVNLEPAPVTNDIKLSSAAMFDIGASYHLAGGWWAGVAFSSVSRSTEGAIDAKVPHPLYFNRPRDVPGTVDDLSSAEKDIHISVAYVLPISGKVDIAVFGGPSRFSVSQDLITDVDYQETYPYDTATFTSATVARVSASAWGFNVGADVTWKLSKVVGVGGMVRFVRSSTTLSADPGNEASVDVGGTQVGGGLRVRF